VPDQLRAKPSAQVQPNPEQMKTMVLQLAQQQAMNFTGDDAVGIAATTRRLVHF